MSTPDAYVATHKCGCMTAWISDNAGDKEVAKFCADHIKDGMAVERVNTEEIQKHPLFWPKECPHDPKGWEPWKPTPYEPKVKRGRSTHRRLNGQTITRASVETPWHRPLSMGDVVKHGKKWLYTDGWFDDDGPTAHYGDDPCEVFEFDTRGAMQDFIAARAMRVSREKWVSYGDHTEEDADKVLAFAEGRF